MSFGDQEEQISEDLRERNLVRDDVAQQFEEVIHLRHGHEARQPSTKYFRKLEST